MEVYFTPELEEKLNDLSLLSGWSADDLVRDAVAGLVDEMAETRTKLDRRYNEIKRGGINLIPGDEAFARLHERIDARRHDPA